MEATPGATGQFDVFADGELIFSKKETGRFPEERELISSCLATLELGRPLLEERGHAFAEVLGLRRRGLQLSLPLELLVQRRGSRAVEQPLRHADRERR